MLFNFLTLFPYVLPLGMPHGPVLRLEESFHCLLPCAAAAVSCLSCTIPYEIADCCRKIDPKHINEQTLLLRMQSDAVIRVTHDTHAGSAAMPSQQIITQHAFQRSSQLIQALPRHRAACDDRQWFPLGPLYISMLLLRGMRSVRFYYSMYTSG